MNNRVAKTLLISGTPPGDSGVGALILRDIVRQHPAGRLAIAIACAAGEQAADREFAHVPSLYLVWPYDWFHHLKKGRLSAIARHLRFLLVARLRDRSLSRAIIEFARSQQVQQVCAVLDTPTMYRIAPYIASALNAELVTIVWDPPSGVGLQSGMDRLSRRVARRHFVQALKASVRCGVISESMQSEYRSHFGVDGVVLRHSVAMTSGSSPDPRRDPTVLRIGFAGSLYAETEWQALLSALESVGWTIGGRSVVLRVLGPTLPRVRTSGPVRVEFRGWRNATDTTAELAECDLTYLPYWFDRRFEESVRLCFATKLTTYLTAGRPVFYHGPQNAALMRFCDRFPVMHGCHSLDPTTIALNLKELAGNDVLHARMDVARRAAVAEELNPRVFCERYAALIGIAPSELTLPKMSATGSG